MTQFHAGPQYDTETQQQLDKLFNDWLNLDATAEHRGYEDDKANAAADAKYAAYELALEIADRIYASDEADKVEPVIRRGLAAQFGQRVGVQ